MVKMKTVKTKDGRKLMFLYDPSRMLKNSGVVTRQILIDGNGVDLTDDEAKVALQYDVVVVIDDLVFETEEEKVEGFLSKAIEEETVAKFETKTEELKKHKHSYRKNGSCACGQVKGGRFGS